MSQKKALIFTDASFDPQARRGVCGYLIILESDLETYANASDISICTQFVSGVTISRLELQTVIFALEAQRQNAIKGPVILYTDCKNVADLHARRARLEATQYMSKRSGKLLAGAELYRNFFDLCDQLNPEIIHVRGHTAIETRSNVEKVFAKLDQKVRAALRTGRL